MTAVSSHKAVSTIAAAALTLVSLLILATGASGSTTLMFQDGVSDGGSYAGTQDVMIQSNAFGQANNLNGFDVMDIYGSATEGWISEALVKFNLGSISPGTTIGSATLTLTYDSNAGATGILNSLYIINNTSSPADAAWTESTAMWNDATTSQLWNGGPGLLSGTDYNATATGTAVTPTVADTAMTFTLDAAGVAAINSWISNPSRNTGFLIAQPPTSGSVSRFYSSENATASFHPELTLITTPEPASLGLLLAGGVMLLKRRRA